MKLLDIINEDEDKVNNRVKNVYRALKKGTITLEKGEIRKVKYVLPDKYYDYSSNVITDIPAIKVDVKDVKFYTIDNNGELHHRKPLTISELVSYNLMVQEKFMTFDIHLSIVGHEW